MNGCRWLAIAVLCAAGSATAQSVTIEGSVRSGFFGTGVVGATVSIQRVTDLLGGGPVVATVTTDAAGLYVATFDGGCGLQCRIRADVPGRVVAPDVRILAAGDGGPQDFVAAEPAVLQVRVEDFATGVPVPGLRPFVAYRDPAPPPTVADLGGGLWRIDGVFPGFLHVCVQADDDAYVGTCQGDQVMPFTNDFQSLSEMLPAEGATQDVVLRVRRGATLTGILTDAFRATPIATTDVQVSLFNFAGTSTRTLSARTDAEGRYRIPGLPPGSYRLQVRIPSPYYIPMRYPGLDCVQPEDCLPNSGSYVSVNGSVVVDNLGFELNPGAVLTGRVTDQATGAPLPGIEVRAYQSQVFIGIQRVGSATTGADGRYAVAHIPLEYPARLGTWNGNGHVDLGWPGVPCSTPECTGGTPINVQPGVASAAYDFALATGPAITGAISMPGTAAGAVQGAVAIYRQDGAQLAPVWTGAIATGQAYQTRGLAAGTYYARAVVAGACQAYALQPCSPGSLPNPATATPIVLPANGTYPGVDFSFASDIVFASGFE